MSDGSLGFNEVKYLYLFANDFAFLFLMNYYSLQICEQLSQGNWTVKHLIKNASKVAIKGKQWISYDDPETVYQKVIVKSLFIFCFCHKSTNSIHFHFLFINRRLMQWKED